MDRAVTPFVESCNSLEELKDVASNIRAVWVAIEAIIELGTKCKKPSDLQTALGPYLQPIQSAIGKIRSTRVDRKFDWHIKAIMEMLGAGASWVVMSAPPAPSSSIKDTVGSSDFWANKIRKEYKGKDDKHIAFCDTLKALIHNLSAYVKEYHLSGLKWNPNGIPIEEYKPPSLNSNVVSSSPSNRTSGNTGSRPASGDVVKELASRCTSDGNSAATGLKRVSREQQTWRKEYTPSSSTGHNSSMTVKPSSVKASQKSIGTRKSPVCKFQEPAKWIIEHQTKTSNSNGVCKIVAKHPKEQVYIYKCENATIQIEGKVKSIILDSCHKSNLVFDTAISACEIVNCNKVQIQSTGVCPSFAIDKTDGCLVYLSKEAVSITSFTTTKSSEMNVSWEDEKSGEQRECPIPEQFVHRLLNGAITSEVSDLYR